MLNAWTVETPELALAAADAADAARAADALKPLSGIPLGIKDLFATEGVDSTSGSNILKGFKPAYESTVSGKLQRRRGGDARQAQHGRVRDGLVERDQRLRAGHLAVEAQRRRQCRADPGRKLGRVGGGGRGGDGAGRHRHRHRRLDPPARGVRRDQRDQADLRPLLALGHRRLRPLARPGRADGADGARLRDHARGDERVRSQGFDLARPAGAAVGSRIVERSQGQARRHSDRISHRRRPRRD